MDENNAAALVATTQAENNAAPAVATPADKFESSRPTSEEATTDITTAVSAVKATSSIATTIEPDSSAVAVTAPAAAPTAPMHDLGLPENSTAPSPTLQQTTQQQQQQMQQQHLVQQQLQQQQQQLAQQQQQQQSRSATTALQAAATHPSSSQQSMYNNNAQPANNLPSCQNCGTQTTPLWRRDEYGAVLCNACGLFLKLHGRPRPISLKTDVIKSRNRVKVARNDGDVKRKQQRIQQQAFPLAPDMNGLDLNAMAQVAARRVDKPDNQNGQRNPLNYTSSVTGFGALDEVQYQAALGQLPAGSGASGLNGDNRDTAQAEIATLKTRVNELELINELFRGRLGQLEHDEATARRGQEISGATETALRQQIDEWVKNNTELRTQLAESHHREEILKRRLEETEAELQEALEASGQPRKRPRVADPLLEDHALALAALGTETYVHGNPQEHDHTADANMHGQLSASDLASQVHQHHTEAARAALMAHMSMPLNNLAAVSAEHIDPAIQSIPEHLQQQMEAGLAAQVEAQAQAQVHADAQAQAMERHVDGLPSAMEVSHTEHEGDVTHMNTEIHAHNDSMDQHIDMSMAVDSEPQQAVSTEEHVISVDTPVVSAQSNKIPAKVEDLAPGQAAEAVEADAKVEVAPELAKVEPASATT